METQPEASGQPTEQLTADAPPADAVPAPLVTPPPGVPVKAPPPSLLAKEEAKDSSQEISQLITLSEDLQVVRFTNGTIHLMQKGKDPETITTTIFDALLQTIRTQASAPALSAMSGLTGLASTNRSSAPDTDVDPIEWGVTWAQIFARLCRILLNSLKHTILYAIRRK